jgi:DNA-binding transcriptional MerR regulator
VADYYNPEQLAQKLGIAEDVLAELESKGLLQPKVKRGMRFFSSRQAYDLRVALRLAQKRKMNLEKAFASVEELRICSGPHDKRLGSEFIVTFR